VRRHLLLVLVLAAGLLSACRLDVDVAVTMDADGSGSVRVRAIADPELVAAEPGVIDGLAVDDLRSAGWAITGPDATPDGGAAVTLDHDYDDAAGLTALLQSIGAPLLTADVVRELNADSTEATNTFTGSLGLPNGTRSFADDQLIETLGAEPFVEVLADGTPLGDRLTFTMAVILPGEVTAHDGDEITTESGEQGLSWSAPLDGSITTVSATSLQRTSTGGSWAEPIATAARIALVVWVAISGSFIVWVIMARRRRARRRSSTAGDPRVR